MAGFACITCTLAPTQAYFCGHDHHLEYLLEPGHNLHYIISGAGSQVPLNGRFWLLTSSWLRANVRTVRQIHAGSGFGEGRSVVHSRARFSQVWNKHRTTNIVSFWTIAL